MKVSDKRQLGLIFGGRSSEHEVSLKSARSVLTAIDTSKYDVELIYISPEGKWIIGENARSLLNGVEAFPSEDILMPQFPNDQRMIEVKEKDGERRAKQLKKLDVVFPVLHGSYGEDGTIQGLFELAGIPYVGAGVTASSAGMDKVIMKDVFKARGLRITDFIYFTRHDWDSEKKNIIRKISGKLDYPVFVKPANTGSSVGISKVRSEDELEDAVAYAAEFDRKILIEKGVDAREIECSVLGNDYPEASIPGEIIPVREFYDYEAKYIDDRSKLIIPAELSEILIEEIRDIAVKAYKSLDCSGMARVDFFLDKSTDKIYINEINTIPGFTKISMYPKLWEASGLPYKELIDRLIELAFERHDDRQGCSTVYKPRK